MYNLISIGFSKYAVLNPSNPSFAPDLAANFALSSAASFAAASLDVQN